jgi:murein DD-endopeptidase MepM/ murein hydrolase activator NlpD
VAAFQFLLASHGFPSGVFDGVFGSHTAASLRRFQRWAGLSIDGRAGPATLAALQEPPAVSPIALAWPLQSPLGDRFGPRGTRFHAGLDFPAKAGTPVTSAAPGRVTWAGWRAGGWGRLVVIAHSKRVRSMYAHLSRVHVLVGERVPVGFTVGLVGATGRGTGPHLHFEVRLRGAAIDPLTALARPV